jgi:hypothetical protein
LPSA